MEKTKLFEQDLSKNGEPMGKIAILFGGVGLDRPKTFMDNEVRKYVGNEPYVQLVDIHLDNPWLRVVIKGVNNLVFDEFINQKL